MYGITMRKRLRSPLTTATSLISHHCIRTVLGAAVVLGAVAFVGCHTSGVDELTGNDTLTLVSPQRVRSADAFSAVPDTIVIEARNASGRRLTGLFTTYATTTGWLRNLRDSSERWFQSSQVIADSTGRVRLLWRLSDKPSQSLDVTNGFSHVALATTLARPGVPLIADTVISSGADAVCVQQNGRVGCVGAPTSTLDPGRLHFLRFASPVVSISNNRYGTCALLQDAGISCWKGLGPDSVLRSDTEHPPFAEFGGTLGRTMSGEVWVKPTQFGAPWIKVASDSAFVALLDQYNNDVACAVTADHTVMCSSVRASSLSPFQYVTPMAIVRDARDTSVVRATGGYTSQPAWPDFEQSELVVRRVDGTNVAFRRPDSELGPWLARSSPDSTLSGVDPSVRTCILVLSGTCDAATPWRSVGQQNDHQSVGSNKEVGYQRICARREFIVCRLAAARTGAAPQVSLDTIRLAP